MSIADKLQTILENEQKVYNAGYEKGKSEGGEKPTLFTPSIELQSVTSVLTITDDNGGFVQGYNVYANDNLVAVLTSKEVTLTDFVEHTETIDIKVQAVGANFNPSDYAVITWKYVNVAGTHGLAYTINAGYATCTGLGDAVETDIVIASIYDGATVFSVKEEAFSSKSITSVVIPDSVTNLGYSAFSSCKSLLSVEIGNGVTTIMYQTFQYCSVLKSVVIGSGVTTIQNNVFNKCNSLKRVDLSKHTSVPTLSSENAFKSTHEDLQIKIPANFYDDGSWASATNWSAYARKLVKEFTNEV